MAPFHRFRQLDQLPRFRPCWICPSNVKVQTYYSLWEHNLQNHLHLLFQCLHDKCNNSNSGDPEKYVMITSSDHKDFNTRKFRCYVTIEEMIQHFKEDHGIEADASQFHPETGFLNDKCALPIDLRKAECMECNKMILCRNDFQVQKHQNLDHRTPSKIKYGCRACPHFHTWRVSQWIEHFTTKDFSSCHGTDHTVTKTPKETHCLKSQWQKRSMVVRRHCCKLCGLEFTNIKPFLEHIRGERHKENMARHDKDLCL